MIRGEMPIDDNHWLMMVVILILLTMMMMLLRMNLLYDGLDLVGMILLSCRKLEGGRDSSFLICATPIRETFSR